jgi:bifunctional non-homologous end joining protein LigD
MSREAMPSTIATIRIAWTDDNLLRQMVYEGLREDKPAAEVRRETQHPKPAT